LNSAQAAYYLANFPNLTRQAQDRREDILNLYRQEAFAGGNKQSGHSDQTASRGILLADGSEIENILNSIKKWIDLEMSPGDRALLIAVWRSRHCGWHYVSKETRLEVWTCYSKWITLTKQLAAYLNQSAGPAPAHPGLASVNSRMKA
jgi:hypothetical protein